MSGKLFLVEGGKWVEWGTKLTTPDPVVTTPFIYGATRPVCANPLNPTMSDNVGWDGDDSGGVFGDPKQPVALTLTLPANTTWRNRVIWANVTMTDHTSRLENCIVFGAVFGGNRPGQVMAPNGGYAERTTFWGTSRSISYYTNNVSHRGGVFEGDRCVFMRGIDGVHTTGANARAILTGCLFGRYAFFDNDADHANDRVRPYWTHNDAFQALGPASTLQHLIFGCDIQSFFDCTGVTWSGGSWGSGTASNGADVSHSGRIGMPATALNAGYWAEETPGLGTWANGITLSNVTGHKALIQRNWINGVNANSGMIQFTVGTTNQPVIIGNEFGLGGKPSGSGKFFLVSTPTGTATVWGTGDGANRFANDSTVPAHLRGVEIPHTANSSSIVP